MKMDTLAERIRKPALIAMLTIAGMLSFATSKTLSGKKLVNPRVINTTPLELPDPDADPENNSHTIWVRENVNNQGCFADQRADVSLSVHVRNPTNKHVVLYEEKSSVTVDGLEYPLTSIQFRYSTPEGSKFEPALPPSTEGTLLLEASSIFHKKKMKDVDVINLDIQTSGGLISYTFQDIRELPMERTR